MPPRSQSIDYSEDDDYQRSRGPGPLLFNMSAFLLIIFFAYNGINWILSDISGVYNEFEQGTRVIRLTLVRKPVSLDGQMMLGDGPALRLTEGGLPKDGIVDLHFELDPDEPRASRARVRKARLIGTVHDARIEGELQANGKRVKVVLKRDGMESLYQLVQSFMP